jgi:phage shock protein A
VVRDETRATLAASRLTPVFMEDIRELLSGLQRDASNMREELDRLTADCDQAEADAMAAVQLGDDTVARECLARHDRLFEARSVIEAQLPRQEAFIATCRELLANVTTLEDGADRDPR